MSRRFAAIGRVVAAAAAATGLVLFIHVAVQQSYRQSADDPQTQMAEDAAASLRRGVSPQAILPAASVDMSTSLAPWLLVVDRADRPIAASVVLDGRTPVPPSGVLAVARRSGENRRSWQPRSGVRSAIVATRVGIRDDRVVIAGRSLREVEARESNLMVMSGMGWVGTLVTYILWAIFGDREVPARPRA